MAKRMLIDARHAEETRVVIADDNQIYDFDFVSAAKDQLKGNIYLAKITRVEPSLQAAFVEYGGGKQGFLPFSEIHPDYYQIPVQDRIRLMEEVASEEVPEADVEQPASEQVPSPEGAEAATEESAIEATTEGMSQESGHPAYLMQGPIAESASSDEIEESAEESAEPFSATLVEESADPTVPSDSDALLPASEQTALDLEPAPASTDDAQPQDNAEAEAKAEGVETLPNEEEEIRPKKHFGRRYKTQEVIRRGQIVLVQVIKEERGNKGCSLTTFLSLAGRYCVLMPNSPKDGGISRKIMSPEDRKRLKSITTELKLASGMSVIIRTAGMDRTRAEIKRDYDYLVKVWNGIRETTLRSSAPTLIYEESNLIKRALRDQYTSDIDELIIEGGDGFNTAREFMKLLLPSHTGKIKSYNDATPLFYAYNIEEQLLSMHDPVVKLKSGGYIVINPTEALISIDVNSGRSTGERNIEETAAKTNLEAAAEVARQLRLRDLAGLIVIDFIDMLESRNRRAVERALKDALKMDRAKIQLGRISPFGLLEMSRQRLRPSISETNMVHCPHCEGRGVIRSNESMTIQMIRAIEKEASSGNVSALKVLAAQDTALYLLNNKRDVLRSIEERYGITITVTIDPKLGTSDFSFEKVRRQGGDHRRNRGNNQQRARSNEPAFVPTIDESDLETSSEEIAEEDQQEGAASNDNSREGRDRDRGRRRRRRGGRNRRDREFGDNAQGNEEPQTDGGEGEQAAQEPAGEEAAQGEARPDRGPRRDRGRRGGRGRKRWKDRDERGPRHEGEPSAPSGESNAIYERPELPAFAHQPAKPLDVQTPKVTPLPSAQYTQQQSAASDGNSKKGWWQKMISLDN